MFNMCIRFLLLLKKPYTLIYKICYGDNIMKLIIFLFLSLLLNFNVLPNGVENVEKQNNSKTDTIINLEDEVASLNRELNLLKQDHRNLLDELKETNTSFQSEINQLYANVDSKTQHLINELVPSKSRYDIYSLNEGDKLGNFVVTHFKSVKDEIGKIVEYEIECKGELTIEGKLYYDYNYSGDVVIELENDILYKLPHANAYEYIYIDNGEDLKDTIGEKYISGMKVALELANYTIYHEDYAETIESVYFKKLIKIYNE